MAVKTVGLLSPGDMGHTTGETLRKHGLRVLTCLAGRSERTRTLAQQAGFEGADLSIGDAQQLAATQGVEAVRALYADRGLRVGGWSFPTDWRGSDAAFDESVAQLPAQAKLAAELGWQVLDQKGEGAIDRLGVDQVVVVEDEDERLGDGADVVEQGGEQRLDGGRLR